MFCEIETETLKENSSRIVGKLVEMQHVNDHGSIRVSTTLMELLFVFLVLQCRGDSHTILYTQLSASL